MTCLIVICDDQPGFRQLLTLVLGLQDAMPERDGLEALPYIRAASPETSVVMLTAFGSASMRRRANEAGAEGLIEKGADLDDLVAQIRQACRV